MVAVVVKVATVLLSGCNSSCSRLQHNIYRNVHSATGIQLLVAWLQWLSGLQQYKLLVATAVAVGCKYTQCYNTELVHSYTAWLQWL